MTDGQDRYIVISADCHGGGAVQDYRDYLDPAYHDDFDAWLATFENPYDDLKGGDADRNWDHDRRLAEIEADGVVAEVIFPNTIPPFFPKSSLVGQPPGSSAGDLARRWAGLQAHNRWLAEFCAAAPGRRAGIAQIMLHDVEASVAEIRWAAQAGLTGGVLLPGCPPGSGLPPLYAPDYEPIWAVCEELGLPINTHSGSTAPDYGDYPASQRDVPARGHLVGPSGAVAAAVRRGHGAPPRPAVRLHRAGHRVGAGRAGQARPLPRSHGGRHRLAGAALRRRGGGPHAAEAERVLRPPVPPGVELHPGPRGAAAPRGRRRQDHVGQRLPPPRRAAGPGAPWSSSWPSPGSTRSRWRPWWAATPPTVYGFDLDVLAPVAARVGPRGRRPGRRAARSAIPDEALRCPAFALAKSGRR